MGNEESKKNNASELNKLYEQLKSSRDLLTDKDIKNRVEMVEDTVVIKYKELVDTGTLKGNIQSLFTYSEQPVQKFLVEVVTNMYSSLSETEEMTEIERSFHRQKVIPVDDKVIGMELHFVVRGCRIYDGIESHESRGRAELLIAYRLMVSTLKGRAEDYPKEAVWQEL